MVHTIRAASMAKAVVKSSQEMGSFALTVVNSRKSMTRVTQKQKHQVNMHHVQKREGAVAHRRHQAEGDAGEDHLQYPHNAHRHRQCPEVQHNHGDCNPIVTFTVVVDRYLISLSPLHQCVPSIPVDVISFLVLFMLFSC